MSSIAIWGGTIVAGVLAVSLGTATHRQPGVTSDAAPTIEVYKSPTCGCCERWIDHLEAAGYRVTAHNAIDLTGIKQQHGVPTTLTSCHTAVAGRYVIEGHVPADVIARLLREKPEIAGIAVPGMPAGAPGMEAPNPVHYAVMAFDHQGKIWEYAKR